MKHVIGDNTYEFSTKLGTTVKISKAFKRKYNDIVKRLGTMEVDDMIKFLHCALIGDVELEEFTEDIYENIGLGDVAEMLMELVKRIQYPNLTIEEIDEKMEEIEKNA